MRILHGFFGFVLSMVILALSSFLILSVFGFYHRIGAFLIDDPLGRLVLGVVLLTLIVVFWLSALPTGESEHFLSFENEGGVISVSVRAVSDLIVGLAGEFPGVVKMRANVAATRNEPVDVELELSVRSGIAIQQLSQALQQRVRESLRESLGIAEMGALKINIREIVAAKPPAREVRSEGRAGWPGPSG